LLELTETASANSCCSVFHSSVVKELPYRLTDAKRRCASIVVSQKTRLCAALVTAAISLD
jgi:hypothetical protein